MDGPSEPPRAPTPLADEGASGTPAEAPEPASAPDVLRVTAGVGVVSRTFDYRDPLSPNLRTYSVPASTLLSASLALLPIGSNEPGAVRAGIAGRYDRSVGMQSALPDGSTTGTSYDRWEAGARVERTPSAGSALGLVGVVASYGVTRFLLDEATGAKVLPEAGYGSISLVGDASVRVLGCSLGLAAGGGHVPQAGVTGRRFPHASGGVARAAASLTVPLATRISAQVRGEYERFFLTMNPEPGDRFVAGGALDQYLRGGIDVLVHL